MCEKVFEEDESDAIDVFDIQVSDTWLLEIAIPEVMYAHNFFSIIIC